MDKESKYRIVEKNFYDKGDLRPEYTEYFIEVEKSFLIFRYWSSIKQSNFDRNYTVAFKTLSDAQKFVEKLKQNKKLHGWDKKVVWGDPEFEKIK